MPMTDDTRSILSKIPIVGDFVDSPDKLLKEQLTRAEIAQKLQEITKAQEDTQKRMRQEVPARFVFGQSPDQTQTTMNQIFQKDIPPEDLVSGNLNSIQSGIDANKQKILSDQAKFGNSTLDEFKTYQQTQRESDYTPKIATPEDEIATGGRIKAGTATTEGGIKILAAMQRTQMLASNPAKTGNFDLQNKKFLVDTLENRKADISRRMMALDKTPGYMKTSPDFKSQYQGLQGQLDAVQGDINALSGLSKAAPSLQQPDVAVPPPDSSVPSVPPAPPVQPALPRPASESKLTLPENALTAVRVANGKTVTFQNGQRWRWDGMQAIKVSKK